MPRYAAVAPLLGESACAVHLRLTDLDPKVARKVSFMLRPDALNVELRALAMGTGSEETLCQRLLEHFSQRVYVPVDPQTRLARPLHWEGQSVMRLFPDRPILELYQRTHPEEEFAVVELKAGELFEWAARLRLGLLILIDLGAAQLSQVILPPTRVSQLSQPAKG